MAPHRVLRIFPDSLRVEQALVDATQERAFVEASGYATFADLLDWCEPARFLGRAACPPITARLVISAAARALPHDAFGAYAREPAFAHAAYELFQQLSLQAGSPEELAQAGEQLSGTARERTRFLVALWKAYRGRLLELHLADRGELLEAAAQRLEREIPPRLKPFKRIEIHHLYDLPPLRLGFLEALARAFHRDFRELALYLPAANNPALDPVGDEVLARVERVWQTLGAEAHRAAPASERAGLIRGLYDPASASAPAPSLELLSVPGPREEVVELAARVRAEIDAGVPPEEIAIVYRDLATEAERLAEALEELGVPARVRLGVPLTATAVGRLALELPRMVDEGFPAASVTRYLESRYAGAVFAEQLDPVKLLQQAGIRDDLVGASSGRGAYSVRLEALAARARPNEPVKKRAAELAERVERLIAIGRALEPEAEARALLDAWWTALERLGLFESLRRHERGDAQSHLGRFVERALARDQAAAESLRFLRDDLAAAWRDSGLGGQQISRRDFARWLHQAAESVNLLPRGPRTGAVELLEARQIAGRHFRRVFVAGLNDGRFPARPPPLPLLSEEDRYALNGYAGRRLFRLSVGEAGAALPFRQAEDRLLFALCLAAGERVSLSRPRFDAQGRELLDSPFVTELRRVSPSVPSLTLGRAAVPALERVASEADLQARVALEVLSRPATRLSAVSPLAPVLLERFGKEPWLERARVLARIEEERDDFFHDPARPPGRFSGVVELAKLDPEQRAMLEFGPEHPASATAFSAFGNCHFKGVAGQLLRLRALEGATEEPGQREKGQFWHLVLEQLLPRVKEKGWQWSRLAERPLDELREVIDAAIDAAAAELGPMGHPALWQLGRENAATMVRRVLFSDTAGLPFAGLEPASAELEFGAPDSPEGWREVVIPPAFPGERPIHLAGKIDRLDEGAGSVGVVDYKTNKARTEKSELLVTDFQLPFYVQAARAAHPGAKVDAAVLGLGDRQAKKLSELADGGVDALLASDAASRAKASEEQRPNLANAAHGLAAALRQGDFGARAHDCKFCDFRSVCRVRQRELPEEGPP